MKEGKAKVVGFDPDRVARALLGVTYDVKQVVKFFRENNTLVESFCRVLLDKYADDPKRIVFISAKIAGIIVEIIQPGAGVLTQGWEKKLIEKRVAEFQTDEDLPATVVTFLQEYPQLAENFCNKALEQGDLEKALLKLAKVILVLLKESKSG
jgi:hypothetical protein